MKLNPSRSLSGRTLFLASLNLFALILLAMAATGVRSPRTMREFLLRTAEGRVLDVSRQVALDMTMTSREKLDALLSEYSANHGATFALFLNDGRHEAGPDVKLPEELERFFDTGRRVSLGLPPPERQPIPPRTPFLVVDGETSGYWLGVRIPIRTASSPATTPGTLIVSSPSFFGSPLLFAPGPWLAWGIAGFAITALCWVPFLRGLTRRIGRMEQATARIAEGSFETELDTRPKDELGRLAASIQSMGHRLGAQVAGQKRFLGDTAHELRSPLGRMQVALAILDRSPDKGSAYLPGLKEDVTEMTRLTDDLLQLAREELMAQHAVARPTNVAGAVQRACRIESRPGDDVRLDVPSHLEAMIDPEALFRAVANVLRNALRYAGEAGPVTVTARDGGDTVTITVADQGPGVPPAALPRLFEPFYRVDEARDRRTGGVGQGLAIVHSAVEACGGTVSCRNLTPHGLEVQLTLPRPARRATPFAAALNPAERA
jgi:two-component system sensor histidine kinase CpxA